MRKKISLFGAAAFSLCATTAFAQDVEWQVVGGTAVIALNQSNLSGAGVSVSNLVPTEFGNYPQEGGLGFTILGTSSFRIMPSNQTFHNYAGGEVNIKGGFTLRSGKYQMPVFNLRVKAAGADPHSTLDVRDGAEGATAVTASLEDPVTYFDIHRKSMTVGWADLKITAEGAAQLGRPELEGLIIGNFSIFANVLPTAATTINPPPGGSGLTDGILDVSLHRMSGLSSQGRSTAAYPNGISGFAMQTTSCNSGTDNIWWYAPMDERHPVILQNMFRIRNGRLEQIGEAYLKHGFLATNTNDSTCGVGQHPGTGSLLGPGLTDTYGAGNNGDRYYLGPKTEVNPLTGEWEHMGSLFDVGMPPSAPDGQRSWTNSQISANLQPHQNRLEVRDQELINQPAGTTFFYEAIYINPRQRATVNDPWNYDINLYNQLGVKRVTPSWNAGTNRFTFTEHDSGVNKVAKLMVDHYVSQVGGAAAAGIAQPQTEGDVWVAVNPINEGGGIYRYEVSVYNLNSDRQIGRVTVPIMPGLTVTDIGFRDIDLNAANDWTGTYADCKIEWVTPGAGNTNAILYGRNYNFFFRANIAPQTNIMNLGLHKPPVLPSTLTSLNRDVMMPPNGERFVAAMFVEWGLLGSGGLAQLATSDDNRVVYNTNLASDTLYPIGVHYTSSSPITNPSQLQLTVESQADQVGRWQIIQFFNYQTNDWETITANNVGPTDTNMAATVNGAANTVKFINQTTKEIKARVILDYGASENEEGVHLKVDMAKWKVTF